MLKLYDLAGAEPERRFSPYCWRARLALAHKGLEVEALPWRFTEKDRIAPSGQEKVPVLVDGDKWVHDSWTIATYLEDKFPDKPSLFGGDAGRALSRFYANWADSVMGSALMRIVALDIWKHLHTKDQDYFRQSREKRMGKSLEAVVADRDNLLPAFRDSLNPLRLTLKAQPLLGGDKPLHPDYIVFGSFMWARSISAFELLAADDPIHAWRERMLDLFGGLGRNAPSGRA